MNRILGGEPFWYSDERVGFAVSWDVGATEVGHIKQEPLAFLLQRRGTVLNPKRTVDSPF